MEVALDLTPVKPDVPSLDEMRRKHSLLAVPSEKSDQVPESSRRGFDIAHFQASMLQGFGMSRDRIIEHNRRVEEFYVEWSDYLHARNAWQEIVRLAFEVELVLVNDGTAPATDIDILLRFPEAVQPCTFKQFSNRPEEPTPPPAMPLIPSVDPRLMMQPHLDLLRPFDRSIEGKPFADLDAREVTFHLGDLKHHHQYQLDPFLVRFEQRDRIVNFAAEYSITLNEAPDPSVGALNFIFSIPEGKR